MRVNSLVAFLLAVLSSVSAMALTLTDGAGGRCEVDPDGGRVSSWIPSADGRTAVERIIPAWPWFGSAGLPGSKADGFAAERRFEVRKRGADSVTLGLHVDASVDPDWDRVADCELSVTLGKGTLSVTLKTTNTGTEPLLLTDGLKVRFNVENKDAARIRGGDWEFKLDSAEERELDDPAHAWRILDPEANRMIGVVTRGNRKTVVTAATPEIAVANPDRANADVLGPGEVKIIGMSVSVCGIEPSKTDVTVCPHDYRVYVPDGRRQVNEHFHVLRSGRPNGYLAFWTQESCEGSDDMHIMFSRSADAGRTWTPAKLLWGSPKSDSGIPNAIWQLPMVSKSGRVYCVWNQREEPGMGQGVGLMMCAASDDDGESWTAPVKLMEARRWCAWQRPLRLAPDGRYLTAVSIADSDSTKTRFIRFENVDDDPDPADLRFTLLGDGSLEGEEASVVGLPDGRLFAVMRSRFGVPLWTESRDGGETWTDSKPLRSAEGRPIRHPRAPCPFYDLGGDAAASGRYFALFTGTYDPEAYQFFGRGPLYRYDGAFDPSGDQPVRFTKGPLLLRRTGGDRYGNSCYSSFTVSDGERVLWYPDNKYNLLGVRIGDSE